MKNEYDIGKSEVVDDTCARTGMPRRKVMLVLREYIAARVRYIRRRVADTTRTKVH